MEGFLTLVQAAAARGANIKERHNGRSLLELAANDGRTDVALWLMEQGLSAEHPRSAAAAAVDAGQLETAAALIERGAKANPVLKRLADVPIEQWEVEPGERLLRALFRASGRHSADIEDWRAMVFAASRLGSVAILEMLARKGSLSDESLGIGPVARRRPLHAAISANRRDAVVALLRAGADPAGKLLVAPRSERQPGDLVLDAVASALSDTLGETPPGYMGLPALHHAVMLGNEAMVRTLLEAGVDPNIEDAHGRTATERMSSRTMRELLRGNEHAECNHRHSE
jgi:hypothetical protein